MKIRRNEHTVEILREEELLDRLKRISEPSSGKDYSTIAVKNGLGSLRLIIATQSQVEESNVDDLFFHAGFNDELTVERRLVDEHRKVEERVDIEYHPVFSCIYSLAEARIEVTKIPPSKDPGPDPSWGDWYNP